MSPEGSLGQILAVVAGNDGQQVEQVRGLCSPLMRRHDVEQAVDAADRALRAGRGRAQKITGPARGQLIRNAAEVVEQALAWCDADDDAQGSWSSGPRGELAGAALTARPLIAEELASAASDTWSIAATSAAATSLDCSCALLAGEGLPGADLGRDWALDRGLTLVPGLAMSEDLHPLVPPSLGQLVAAATRRREEAFAEHLGSQNFAAAAAVVDLLGSPDDTTFDPVAAHSRLVDAEHVAREQMRDLWLTVEAHFAENHTRGRIESDEAARLHGLLLDADPSRKDLGQVSEELLKVDQYLTEAVGLRRLAVTEDVQAASDAAKCAVEGQAARTAAERRAWRRRGVLAPGTCRRGST